ncbi:MAG: tRNA (N6-isopentenyl adenosine(37)-C2)-methylthiotransferase MiaB [Candidatus Parcubacteria bacterium]|nr:tRNA (N6-isopentenyl adenosine(37)-C2)-methylthiotransferase MiaB [Candidatus Parcubacteria bacterium]
MKYFLYIYGCQMNISDAERIEAVLGSLGYNKTKLCDDADLVIFVTCSVRQSAEDRVWGIVRNLNRLRSKGKKLKVILTGCMALRKEVVRKMTGVDIFLDIKDLNKLPQLLGIKPGKEEIESYLSVKPKYENKFTAYVPIMTGCNNFCAYCIVPYVRGREMSRSPQEVIKEVKELIKKGYKEIILLGQNVNSYAPELKIQSSELRTRSKNSKLLKITDFPDLLEYIAQLSGNFWLSFLTSHPKDLSDKLIEVIAKNPRICPYINLPVQAGDDLILKKMNRKYTVKQYKLLVKKIRKSIPEVAISTDIIVGFPGESKKQFLNSVKLFKDMKYDMAYLNQYSPREGTASAKMKDTVSHAEKERRDKELDKVLNKTALAINKKLVGKVLDVLVERKGKSDLWLAKTKTFKVVKFTSDKNLLGKFVKIKITKAKSFGLEGDSVDSLNSI